MARAERLPKQSSHAGCDARSNPNFVAFRTAWKGKKAVKAAETRARTFGSETNGTCWNYVDKTCGNYGEAGRPVPLEGLEPTTPSLRMMCSTS